MTKLANPCTKTEIINRLAINESSNDIAKDYNVSGQRIRQIKKENQELIEAKSQELLQNLPDIVETVKLDIQSNKELSKHIRESGLKSISKEELQFKTITNKLSADILRSVGIFPAQHPSFVFNQFNDNSQTNTVISPAFQVFLDFQASNGEKMLEDSDDNSQAEL